MHKSKNEGIYNLGTTNQKKDYMIHPYSWIVPD